MWGLCMGCAEHLGLQEAALGLMPSAPALLSQLGPARPLEVCKRALKALVKMMSLLVRFPWGSSSSKKGGPKSLHPALMGAAPHNPRSQGCLGCGCPPWLRAHSARGLLHQAWISWVYFSSYPEKQKLNFLGEDGSPSSSLFLTRWEPKHSDVEQSPGMELAAFIWLRKTSRGAGGSEMGFRCCFPV